jgi:DNA-binding winged helix-turn-helix (wHTH) protein
MPQVAFKFFLPTEMESELGTALRQGRFPAYKLSWDSKDLSQMLKSRLKHFNTEGIDTLAALAKPEIKGEIDEKLVEYAANSPRRLIALGRDLVEQKRPTQKVAGEKEDEVLWLTREDLLAVLEQSDRLEYGTAWPTLRLGRERNLVLIGRRSIELTPQQFEVLRLLYDAEGDVKSRDDIAFTVYRTADVTNQAIDSMIWRIRQRIERDPTTPQYLITERGEGYWLQNTDRTSAEKTAD